MDLRIVIATLNSEKLLKECLISIIEHTKNTRYEICVIDNGSKDGTLAMIENEFPNIKIIPNKKNLGVAPSRNQGFKNLKSRYILILDADTTLKSDAMTLIPY